MGTKDLEMAPGDSEQYSDSLLPNTRCGFCCCFGSRGSSGVGGVGWWEKIRSSKNHGDDYNPWWSKSVRAFKKIREWSEIVAGPKWKTFIRRFNRNHRGSGNSRHGKFQYDPLSYALNFDEGPGGQNGDFDQVDDYGGFRDFSSRYASVSGAGKPLAVGASS